LIYLALLVLPNSTIVSGTFLARLDVLLSAVVGSFVISPPIGYVIYTFYDSLLYERVATYPKWRTVFRLLDKNQKLDTTDKKKAFLDLVFRIHTKDSIKVDPSLLLTIRGIWSHFNARIVCSIFVPAFSVGCFLVLYAVENALPIEIFRFRSFTWSNLAIPLWLVPVLIIATVSLVLILFSRRPYRETCRLEEYLFLVKDKEVKKALEVISASPQKPNKKESDKEKSQTCAIAKGTNMCRDTELLKIQVYTSYCHSDFRSRVSYMFSAIVAVYVSLMGLFLQKTIDAAVYYLAIAVGAPIFALLLLSTYRDYRKSLSKVDSMIQRINRGESLPSIEDMIKRNGI